MNKVRFEHVISLVCLLILGVFMCLVIVGFIHRKSSLKQPNNTTAQNFSKIDFQKEYPFSESDKTDNKTRPSFTKKINNAVRSFDKNLNNYLTVYLPGYYSMAETGRRYEQLLQWNYNFYGEYNSVVKLSDGYLTSFIPKEDISEDVQAIADLDELCKMHGIEFVYIQAFNKINAQQDPEIYGTLDFSNQNVDNFLESLRNKGINTFDLREKILSEQLPQHQLFFRTDHHWLPQTARWASQQVLQFLANHYEIEFDSSILNSENFKEEVYRGWFLGSQGKKLTLAQVEPEDFTLLYPKYPHSLEIEVPGIGYKAEGEFDVTYDMSQLDELDYYSIEARHTTMYDAYGYGQRPLVLMNHRDAKIDKKVLLIRDSFSDTALPFLALGITRIHALDLRLFTGSVKQYISSENPDIVIVMYTPSALGPVDKSTHTALFDFR